VPLAALAGALGLAIAGCGGGPSPNSHTSPPSLHGSDTVVAVGHSQYGQVLTDGTGATLYLFTGDESGTSTCTGTCAKTWRPYIAQGRPHTADETLPTLQDALLETVERPDGRPQVAYKGHPLYYYSGDEKPGTAKGEGRSEFGGTWYLVEGSGKKVYP
jgi:predicted lipoprotein with Yx(FWY)xxD motif